MKKEDIVKMNYIYLLKCCKNSNFDYEVDVMTPNKMKTIYKIWP